MKYSLIADAYEKIEATTKRLEMTDHLVNLLKETPKDEYTVSGSKVTLKWDDTSSNELGFEIERKEGSKSKYRVVATVGQNVTTYTDTGLSPGTTYHYRVRAYNSQIRSDPSNEIRVMISAH